MNSALTLKFLLFKERQLQVTECGDIKFFKKKQTYGKPFSREVASVIRKRYSKFIEERKKPLETRTLF